MTMIKNFTDIDQSKKLAEILPLESADMYYSDVPVREWIDKTDTSKGTHVVFKSEIFAIENLRNHEVGEGDIYAWSLTTLLGYLSEIKPQVYTPVLFPSEGKWILQFAEYGHGNVCEVSCDNPVDACYEMILKLHELNML